MSKKGKYSKNGKVVVYKPAELTVLEEQESAPLVLSFAEFRNEAADYLEKQHWGKLLELSATPLGHFAKADQDAAQVQLLQARVWALARGEMNSLYGVADEDRPALVDALRDLHRSVQAFDVYPEFTLFCRSFSHSSIDTLSGYQALSHSLPHEPSFLYTSHLRRFGLRLMKADQWEDEDEPSPELRAQVPKVTEIVSTLREAYARARVTDAIEPDQWLKLKFFDMELEWHTVDPWDAESVAKKLLEFDETPLNLLDEVTLYGPYLPITPRAWGFLWELSHAGGGGLQSVLEKYSEPLGNDLCEGLKYIIKSYYAQGPAIDACLLSAVRCFSRFHAGGSFDYSHVLVVDHPLYRGALELDFLDLECPLSTELILRVAEGTPDGYSRVEEVFALYSTIEAARLYGQVEAGQSESQHFRFLCQSHEFQWMAASTMATSYEFAMLSVDALIRAAEGEWPLAGHLTHRPEGSMSHAQTMRVLNLLKRFASVRPDEKDEALQIRSYAIQAIFSTLDYEKQEAVELALEVGRSLVIELDSADGLFKLGFLEQRAGGQAEAVSAYLESLRFSKSASESLKKNVQILLANMEDLETAEEILRRLRDFSKFGCCTESVDEFLRDAERRLKTHKSQDQFERTAVNRWPSLTAQARKLLGTLHQIDGYHGFDELARYAGMDEVWAERHYKKLIELGMVLESKGKWEVNPHVIPMLERESQHSVVGRIIRSKGTTAVKQVFNSQREFSIYQILVQLCPNHLVFPNCSLQSIMSYDKLKELVEEEDFGYYLRASVDIVVVSTTTYLPMLAIEVDSTWHDTERQIAKDERKDRLFSTAGIPFMRLRPLGSPSEDVIRGQVAERLNELIGNLRSDIPGYEQAKKLLDDLSGMAK